MIRDVHSCLVFSEGYGGFGMAFLHKPSPMIVLRFPEDTLLSTPDRPSPSLHTRSTTR